MAHVQNRHVKRKNETRYTYERVMSHTWTSHVTHNTPGGPGKRDSSFRQHTATHCNTCNTHCNTLQHTTTHCNTVQHTAIHYNTQQHSATNCNTLQHTLQHTATHYNTLQHTPEGRGERASSYRQHTAAHCSTLQHTAAHCSTLQHTAAHCSTLQHTATHCNILQHTATHCSTLHHTQTPEGRGEKASFHRRAKTLQTPFSPPSSTLLSYYLQVCCSVL